VSSLLVIIIVITTALLGLGRAGGSPLSGIELLDFMVHNQRTQDVVNVSLGALDFLVW
jgi:hypothetical protein